MFSLAITASVIVVLVIINLLNLESIKGICFLEFINCTRRVGPKFLIAMFHVHDRQSPQLNIKY